MLANATVTIGDDVRFGTVSQHCMNSEILENPRQNGREGVFGGVHRVTDLEKFLVQFVEIEAQETDTRDGI